MPTCRFLLPAAAAGLLVAACTFGGGGLVPGGTYSPARISEEDLEIPFVATPQPVVEKMLEMAGASEGDYLIDLGSGDGRIGIAAARRGARSLGVDIDPDRVVQASRAAAMAGVGDQARFRRQDLFATPLAEASIVTLYLLPEINLRLRPRLLTELRPGARIVSHNFDLGDWEPDQVAVIGASRALLWVVPAVAGGEWVMERGGDSLPLRIEQRFQSLSGSLAGRPLRDMELRGTRIRFTADLDDGAQRFEGQVGEAEILPDPDTAPKSPAWRVRRAG